MKLRYVLLCLALLVLALAVGFYLPGCASAPAVTPVHHLTDTPKGLTATATFLDLLIPAGILGVIAGVALLIFAPEEHAISLRLVGVGIATFGVSAVLRISLWVWPLVGWGAAAVLVIGGGLYLYKKYKLAKLPLVKA